MVWRNWVSLAWFSLVKKGNGKELKVWFTFSLFTQSKWRPVFISGFSCTLNIVVFFSFSLMLQNLHAKQVCFSLHLLGQKLNFLWAIFVCSFCSSVTCSPFFFFFWAWIPMFQQNTDIDVNHSPGNTSNHSTCQQRAKKKKNRLETWKRHLLFDFFSSASCHLLSHHPTFTFLDEKDWYGAGIFAPSGRKYLKRVIGRCVGGEKYKKEWRESMLITVSS